MVLNPNKEIRMFTIQHTVSNCITKKFKFLNPNKEKPYISMKTLTSVLN